MSGLEGGRLAANQRHRRKKLKDQISSGAIFIVAVGAVSGAAYVGYTIYEEQQVDDRAEHDRRVAEIDAQRRGQTTDDLIVELRDSPRWNGPGAPAFGVGADGSEQIEITEPTTP